MTVDPAQNEPRPEIDLDLGFGTVVSRESRQRLLNRDGSFNVRRVGLSVWQELSPYHYFLTISWPTFLGIVAGAYLVLNVVFAFAYMACGAHALTGFPTTLFARFWIAFFFSVETIATIGYGNIVPVTLVANLLMTVESLFGIIAFALVAGIVFARFARPTALILFSQQAVIAPYRDTKALMFRIVNQRRTQIVNLAARVLLTRRKDGATGEREYVELKLERDSVTFFPLSWTIVHPIDADSPLRTYRAPEDLRVCDSEFLILLNGFDETFSQTVHTRSSYRGSEVVWGARFRSMFNPPEPDGSISIDVRKIHEIERVPLPA
ncbi:MAG TPA: ion channel [Thermoanaerobaculia bacterium]|nr:ion channel [Thermoanaerobaculia bacterium]